MRRLNRIETCGESLRAALEETAGISPGFVVPLLKAGWDQRHRAGAMVRGGARTGAAPRRAPR